MTRAPLRTPARGVSLIEAMVGFAIMAFGMLGVVGIQSALRQNADLAKQRTEAVRIAQEQLETWRVFSVFTAASAASGAVRFVEDIVNLAPTTVVGYTTNTTYTVTGTVTGTPPADKTLTVAVTWADRASEPQRVQLASALAGVAPELTAGVVTPPTGDPVLNPLGRNRNVPPQARNFGDGTSGFLPRPGVSTVGWLFNNATGVIRICTVSNLSRDNTTIVAADFTNCGAQLNLLLSGFIRYATGQTAPYAQPAASDVADDAPSGSQTGRVGVEVDQTAPTSLTGTVSCFVTTRQPLPAGGDYREYFCAIPIEIGSPAWSGTVEFVPSSPTPAVALAASSATVSANEFRVCRYRATGPYTLVKTGLTGQNYVIIRAGDGTTPFTCPAPTFRHQP